MTHRLFYWFLASLLITGCISKKKFIEAQNRYTEQISKTELELSQTKAELVDAEKQGLQLRQEVRGKMAELSTANGQIKLLQEQQDYLKKTNAGLLERLTELSVLNKTGAENMKRTLDAMEKQGQILNNLREVIQKEDSLNLNNLLALNQSMPENAKEYLNWQIKDKSIYIICSPKIYNGVGEPEASLGKIATILEQNPEASLQLYSYYTNLDDATTVETSFKRAAAMALIMKQKFNIEPKRITISSVAASEENLNTDFIIKNASKNIQKVLDQIK